MRIKASCSAWSGTASPVLAVLLAVGCTPPTEAAPQPDMTTLDGASPTATETPAEPMVDVCTSPRPEDHLFPPFPDVPSDCLEDYWDCPLEPGYASESPTTTCTITEGFDEDGAIQEAFWEAYNFGRDTFGSYGPVYVYMMGPTSEASNVDIWTLRAERRAVVDACRPVEDQIDDFFDNPFGQEELDAAITGEGGYFSISGNSGCNPVMDMMVINPELESIRSITLHEYHHVFQLAHSLTWDRDSEYGLNSWIMEGQATFSSAYYSGQQGWGPSFEETMLSMKTSGPPVSPVGIDAFLAAGNTFALDDESYWERGDETAGVVYYQLGAWAWAWLVHDLDGDIDRVLKDYIRDVPELGKSASFERHFGRTVEAFFVEFEDFVQSDEEAWRAILE